MAVKVTQRELKAPSEFSHLLAAVFPVCACTLLHEVFFICNCPCGIVQMYFIVYSVSTTRACVRGMHVCTCPRLWVACFISAGSEVGELVWVAENFVGTRER